MRTTLLFAVALPLLAATTHARATVTEPDGTAVPIQSQGEEQLFTLFTDRNENINWQTDAHTTPNAFSPLCGFTATYVLNQAADSFGLSWYNDTGTTPTAADLHPLVSAGSSVGTTFSGTVIRSDPAYAGGLVGFALVGGETHYTNPAYDTLCSGCKTPGPWITALMYASSVTPNAYYICFEDGPTGTTSWSNDGDFNDDVYFVTGISCLGGGQTCDTGKPGICAAGLTQCSADADAGTNCVELNPPATTETCNGLDDNCNGSVDEGAICPTNFVCQQGTCVQSCHSGEFKCGAGLECSSTGYCVDPQCENVTCPTGQVCAAGVCKGPCDGITCPYPQECRVGACVDPCASVTCQAGQVCQGGVCIEGCSCQPCGTGKACDAPSGACIETACTGVTCTAGKHCAAGTCVDNCSGAVCPTGQACQSGSCVPSAPTPVDGGGGGGGLTGPTGDDGGATGSSSGGTPDGSTGAGGDDGGPGGNGASSGGGSGSASSGCGCRTGDPTGGGGLGWLVALGLAIGIRRARRRA